MKKDHNDISHLVIISVFFSLRYCTLWGKAYCLVIPLPLEAMDFPTTSRHLGGTSPLTRRARHKKSDLLHVGHHGYA